jgi:hypothetical protein
LPSLKAQRATLESAEPLRREYWNAENGEEEPCST